MRRFRKMALFCIVDIPILFPPKSMFYFGSSSLAFTSDNIDSWGEGFTLFKRNEIVNELIV